MATPEQPEAVLCSEECAFGALSPYGASGWVFCHAECEGDNWRGPGERCHPALHKAILSEARRRGMVTREEARAEAVAVVEALLTEASATRGMCPSVDAGAAGYWEGQCAALRQVLDALKGEAS